MRITGWHIDGFGVFRDHAVRDLPGDLTVVVGPNEAGKSTLLAYLRAVLFGFPDRRSRDKSYPPLHGGRHGGRVFLADSAGAYTLERHRGSRSIRLTMPDGREGTEEDLAQLVGHADADVFRNLFAFSLTELESFGSLDTEAVRERIFTAGVIGAGRSARQAVAALDRRRDTLLKPRATSAEITRLTRELKAADERLTEARRVAAQHREARTEAERWAAELARLTAELADRRETIARCSLLLDLWPDWSDGFEARRELSFSDDAAVVPDDAETQLERLTTETAAADAARAEREAELGAVDRRLATLAVDDRLASVAKEVRALYADLSAHAARASRAVAAERSVRELGERLDAELTRLGADWDRDRIAALDPSIPAEEEVRALETRLHRADDRRRLVEEELEAATARVSELTDEHRQLQQQLRRYGDVPQPRALDEQETLIRRLRAVLADHGVASARLEAGRQTLEQLRSSGAGPSVPFLGLPPWLRPALAGLAVLLAAGGVALFAADLLPAALGAGLLAAVVAVIAFALRPGALRGVSAKEVSGRAARQERLRATEAEVAQREAAVADLAAEVRALAERLDLPELPTAVDLEDRDALADRQRRARAEAERVSAQLQQVGTAKRQAERELAQLTEQAGAAREADEQAQSDWITWKAERGAPAGLTPRGALDFLASVDRVRSILRQLEPAEAEQRLIVEDLTEMEQRVAAVLHDAGAGPDLATHGLGRAVTELAERVAADEAVRRDRALVELERDAAATRLAAAQRRLETGRDELHAFLESVAAADPAEARERIAKARQHSRLAARVQASVERVNARLDAHPDADALRAELATGDVAGWHARRADAEGDLGRLEAEREEAVRRQHDADNRVAVIENSSDVAKASLERESLRAQLADAVGQWQELSMARGLVTETLRRYERERQPAVMARASALFSAVTEGRYEQVVVSSEGGLDVIDHAGQRLDTADLSRGTAEQLYLCVRFGLAAEFAAHAAALPLVMDDVLVNFDPGRARGMAGAIARVADDHQVLLFTSHPQVVETLVELRPTTRVLELQRRDPLTLEPVLD